jgi:hypothetical protein
MTSPSPSAKEEKHVSANLTNWHCMDCKNCLSDPMKPCLKRDPGRAGVETHVPMHDQSAMAAVPGQKHFPVPPASQERIREIEEIMAIAKEKLDRYEKEGASIMNREAAVAYSKMYFQLLHSEETIRTLEAENTRLRGKLKDALEVLGWYANGEFNRGVTCKCPTPFCEHSLDRTMWQTERFADDRSILDDAEIQEVSRVLTIFEESLGS